MADFLMPRLGADMTEATLVAWKVQPGDEVTRGMVVAEVDTAKGVIDVECFQPGRVVELVAQEGELLPVGAVMARIQGVGEAQGEADETGGALSREPGRDDSDKERGTTKVVPAPAQKPGSAGIGDSRRQPITPRARRLAEQAGIDLATVRGSGPNGAISAADVELAMRARGSKETAGAQVLPLRQDLEPTERMRSAIAVAMERANREIPHYYLRSTVDMQTALDWLQRENGARPVAQRLLPVTLSLKAAGLALREVPELNGFWREGSFQPGGGIHIGFAIAMRGGGLVTPAIHDVDQLSLDQLMARLMELIPRARAGRMKSSELTDGTCTLTSLGDLGVATVWGVIYPPQVALVGTGQIALRPWVVEAEVVPRPLMEITLAGDHRASDGIIGARFVERFERLLQTPQAL